MKYYRIMIFFILVIVLITGCGTSETPEVSTATIMPMPSDTPVPTATRTNTPEPTPLPGVETIPLSEFKHGVPWLSLDEANRPMSIFYVFSTENAPFNDPLVRKAFVAAVNKEEVIKAASNYYLRDASEATNLTPPSVLGRDLTGAVGIVYDPEQAKAYLAEAGYPNGEDFPPVTLWVYQRTEKAPSTYYRITVDAVVPAWKEVLGVDVTVKSIDKFLEGIETNPPELFLFGWGADYIDPKNFLGDLFSTDGEFNYSGYSNPEFDDLVDQASKTHDTEEKQALYIQAEKILCEQDTVLIPLIHSFFFVDY